MSDSTAAEVRACVVCGLSPANYFQTGLGRVCGYAHVRAEPAKPIPMRLICPACGMLHVDEGEFAVKEHHTHACQGCGMVWRPAVVATVGVQFLPGFQNVLRSQPVPPEKP